MSSHAPRETKHTSQWWGTQIRDWTRGYIRGSYGKVYAWSGP